MESCTRNGEKADIKPPTPDASTELPVDLTLTKAKPSPVNAVSGIQSHLNTYSPAEPGPPPDGGVLAWSQVFCAWLAIVNSWGFVNR